ncbi:hypothetical protein RclHR1_00230010 [Rhizophagus clarus]|uniref:Putative transmembrane amino acid transporter n=1 Tax=Rhizophagus clarus TaxID=94130 RepID=A0A2Z6QZT8_9GLOM|nr:hypothetical protein RclHR1_00230010 [Rhizophagus clarus]GES72914.1 putative transmembrane amino acid transporter [Rhizophagus clarus]
MATHLQGQRRGEPTSGREYENNVAISASGITDNTNERTPLISRPDTIIDDIGKSTVKQTVFNSVNALMGIAILSLPFAFKYAGWVFGVLIFLFCLIQTNYTAKLIKKCLDTDPGCLTYADLAYLAFGKKGRLIMGSLFLMDLFNATVALMILTGDSLQTLFPNVDLVHLKLIAFFIITPTTWMPFHFLSHVSVFGIAATASLAAVVLIDGFTKFESPGSLLNPMDTHFLPPNWMAFPLAFGLINAGFTGHAVFPSLYRDMAKPESYNSMVNYSYLIASSIYITVAASGYLMFGSTTMEEITLNIMSTPGFSVLLNSFVIWMIVINPLSKYPLMLTPINISIEVVFFKIVFIGSKFSRTIYTIISRTFVSFLIVYTSIAFPEFDRAMSLLGAFFSFLISAIFPILCYLKIFGHQLSNKSLAINIMFLVISTIMAIIGTIWTFFPREWLDKVESHMG